jgi:hypothetical protein
MCHVVGPLSPIALAQRRVPSIGRYRAENLVAGRCSGFVDISYGSGSGNKNYGSGRSVNVITGTDPSRILPGHLRNQTF